VSRAFIKESDGDEVPDVLPDRPVSPHPHWVTAEGLARIDAEIARLVAAQSAAQAQEDKQALATIGRDLRYCAARRATAEVIPPPTTTDKVGFGSTVTIARDDGRRLTYRIVGEDEADPAQGTLSYVSPLARALLGKTVGDVVPAGKGEAEIVAIRVEAVKS
jgi:transcription elongation GreA/GreB family factor